MATVIEKLNAIVERLPLDRQQRVLEYAEKLIQSDQDNSQDNNDFPTTPLPPGTPGNVLARLRFQTSLEAAKAMEQALEDCERINTLVG